MVHTVNLLFVQKWAHKFCYRRRDGIFCKFACCEILTSDWQKSRILIWNWVEKFQLHCTSFFLSLFVYDPFLCYKSIVLFQCTAIVLPNTLPQNIVSSFMPYCWHRRKLSTTVTTIRHWITLCCQGYTCSLLFVSVSLICQVSSNLYSFVPKFWLCLLKS